MTQEVLATGRLPDFIILGAMKAGTTSLYRWLGEHPSCHLPAVKEPNFFSVDDNFSRGEHWYRQHFADVPQDRITGEASVSYTDPDVAAVAAKRMRRTVPRARLIFLARHPESRLRSHYLHEVQRGRERRPLVEVLRQPTSAYVERSCYWKCLSAYVQGGSELHFVTIESLTGPNGQRDWANILSHLGLPRFPRPVDIHNVADTKRRFRGPATWLWNHGYLQGRLPVPRPIRRLVRPLLLADPSEWSRTVAEVRATKIPAEVRLRIWSDTAELQHQLRLQEPLWDPDPAG